MRDLASCRRSVNPLAPPLSEPWTPQLAGEVMLDAARWAKASAGAVGPRSFARIAGLTWSPTLADHLAEGWGLPDAPDPDDIRKPMPAFTQDQIRLFSSALLWQGRYLAADGMVGSSRMLGLWIRSKVHGENIGNTLHKAGVSRAHAYRLRDRALSRIAIGLTADRVLAPRPITLSS